MYSVVVGVVDSLYVIVDVVPGGVGGPNGDSGVVVVEPYGAGVLAGYPQDVSHIWSPYFVVKLISLQTGLMAEAIILNPLPFTAADPSVM